QIALARLGLAANYIQLGEFIQAHEHIDKMLDFYDFRQHPALASDHPFDPGINGIIWAAWVSWVLGYPDQAKQYGQEAVEMARILAQPLALAAALEISGFIMDISMCEYTAVSEKIQKSLQLAADHKFYTFELEGAFYQGLLQIIDGAADKAINQMKQAMAGWRATGMRIMYTHMLGFLAESMGRIGQVEEGLQTLDEAFSEVETRDEHFFEAELYRIKGDLLQKNGAETPVVESAYRQAIAVARQQAAKSWELRATVRLAHLWQGQGKIDEARTVLSGVYNWFMEGFNTPDLQEAQSLLEILA
ncbi:MAG: hypothetical protein H6669_18535, partial [Ardenticatenaceae bacterium]|nr:hypothetical protein [Ardenticatenaceae bacterium]